MNIYKIFRTHEWEALQKTGLTNGSAIDVADGYIHFSTAAQVIQTAAKHFTKENNLILAACDSSALENDLKWEPSRGGALFPHLYRALFISDILWHTPLELINEHHHFPQDLL